MATQTTPLSPEVESSKFQTAQVAPVVAAHLVHDIYTSSVPSLLPLLIEKLSLMLTQAGLLSAMLQLPGILNPLFGYIADRVSVRYFVIFAPAVTGTAISLIGFAPDFFALAILLFVAGISNASFHTPAPAMISRVSGRKVGLGMGLFMAAGELASAIGPLIAVWVVTVWTLDGYWRIGILGWTASLLLYLRLRGVPARTEKPSSIRPLLPALTALFLPLGFINLARFPLVEGLTTFLPTYMTERGAGLWLAGGSLSIIMTAGVLGVLTIGPLSDRIGRKPVLIGAALVSFVLTILFLNTSGYVRIAVLFVLGYFSMSTPPVLMAIVQEQFPQHRATANGIYMATMFALRPLGTLLIGFLGDVFSLDHALLWGALISLLTIPAILKLPK